MNTSIGDVETENNFGSTNEHLRNSSSKKSSERVKFASHVEVFHSDDTDDQEENPGNKLVRGKRFTREEDQILKDAVHKYIEAHKLGEKGLDMILQCRRHPNIRGCWREIGAALPYRPLTAIYDRGHTLFERAESHEWTSDEKAFVLKFYEKHGLDWKSMSQVLAKDKKHVKDAWRRTFRAGLGKGKWTQMEYQSLFHIVNKDLRMHVYEEKKSKHGMIRDNIG
ncbi:DNA-binding protein REB1-like [Papaver somniferum]|uniref:DNA-binding protein REB1-like n=1 Tax=Papaver somniferum TaxID=3469 RepID=UPI000E6F5624|nr:DNA-binding protein REB1-like [Papaver somniferum]XP_026436956.1 DNA-binding protein REB1-like [Papaver somniferum]XP_026436957.1 DNA-binding protein REB1-like [Papaver somniferum]XP_026436958.1 DNA-binding protein REB1-like [Papaver somniferum]XP_026436959.1 DNA-binding protein REB1-like [Papaver somniferum]